MIRAGVEGKISTLKIPSKIKVSQKVLSVRNTYLYVHNYWEGGGRINILTIRILRKRTRYVCSDFGYVHMYSEC